LSDKWVWNQYWHYDRIASCFDGAGAANYDESIAAGWRGFFEALPAEARILDLCTGNGAAALIAAETGRRFAVTAVDRADIDPPTYVTRHAEALAAIDFRGATEVEALPFADASFEAAVSQYGIEYSDLSRSLPELARVVAPGGRARLVIHAADGVIAAGARDMLADADLLLDDIDLAGSASRCFSALAAVERDPGASGEARRGADESFAAFQSALERTARHVPAAADRTMVRNSGAVLLDTFTRRGHFDLDQLLAKAGQVETEIRAHRGRLNALIDAALDGAQSAAVAARLEAAGASKSAAAPLHNADGLIAYVVEARF
jgi:SAM-dependent methyltransferase